ncbi:hypothetical protein OsJ_05086 [Oryza sativa Japonica Group]|jgi:hypothetical protein|uniref:Reverse transcriptase zinc-binding domain-containing protein n=1 Tax=Oryza sativa subsp. japonica TaxID=39947 RepID=B9F228_ORYSJ|nr:hypothetical protein OsJ_05086 [Oryza sativa Japonica Group]
MARELCVSSELIWTTKTPSKVRFFLWLAAKGHCSTADNLEKKGWPHEEHCVLCQREDESCSHLLLTCDYTQRVWLLMKKWIGISFPVSGHEEENLTDWWTNARRFFRTGYRDIFDSVVALICWSLWKERNVRIFEQKVRTPEQLVEDIKEEILVWKTAGVIQPCNNDHL